MGKIFNNDDTEYQELKNNNENYLGTNYILNHKADFEPGRTSDFILKIKFDRDLYDMNGQLVCEADEATEALALSLRNFTGPTMSIEPISIRTGNGEVKYAGTPTISTSPITFTDYIGMKTEYILLAWYTMAHNVKNDKIGFKEYYSQDGFLYKWAPNGTRQINWWLKGCWISEFAQGEFNRQSPEQRMFSSTIQYDKAIPKETPSFDQWVVKQTNRKMASNTEYTQYTKTNYIGTLSDNLSI